VLSSYARLAAWVFVLVVITGTLSAVLLVPLTALITTTYGRVLVVKLVLVALAAALGYAGRRAWRADRLDQARARVGVEVSVLVAVLAASAVLVSTPPVTASPPVPPPPRGAVVPLGMLAGQISVAVAASDGQLVVRLATGRRGDYYAPAPHQGYTLAGQLLPPRKGRGPGAPLAFRGCGEGCFVAPAAWARGDNVLTLRAQAADWRGGTVSLLLPWPARPGGTELAHAAQLMRATAQVTVYEAVTSDTTGAPPVTNRLRLAGEFFLSQEPYASGVAPIAARISPDGHPVRLALGYPAAAINATLTLDAAGRISEETLTDTTHLIHRRFAYPDHN
jgi:copper transport protein